MKSLKKGDFMLRCDHVIELVAKTALAYKKQFKRELKVDIAERY